MASGFNLSVKHNFPALEREMRLMQEGIRGPATARALNRSIDPARPEMAREISREFNLSVTEAKDRLKVTHARYVKGQLTLAVSLEATSRRKGRSLNLIRFVERFVSNAQARRRRRLGTLDQLHFKIKRSGPAKTIKGAFIANQGRTVFQRVGKDRLPIKAVQTIDVGQMFNTKRVNQVITRNLLERFPTIWRREVAFYTDRFNRTRLPL